MQNADQEVISAAVRDGELERAVNHVNGAFRYLPPTAKAELLHKNVSDRVEVHPLFSHVGDDPEKTTPTDSVNHGEKKRKRTDPSSYPRCFRRYPPPARIYYPYQSRYDWRMEELKKEELLLKQLEKEGLLLTGEMH